VDEFIFTTLLNKHNSDLTKHLLQPLSKLYSSDCLVQNTEVVQTSEVTCSN